LETGGADRDRTDDLLNANQALSQLSYSPLFREKKAAGFSAARLNSSTGFSRPVERDTRSPAHWLKSNIVGKSRVEIRNTN
jgi:hypothetical protein